MLRFGWQNLRSHFCNYRIQAAFGEGVAAQKAPGCHESATKCAVALDCFHGVFGAGRDVAAGGREGWGNPALVKMEER